MVCDFDKRVFVFDLGGFNVVVYIISVVIHVGAFVTYIEVAQSSIAKIVLVEKHVSTEIGNSMTVKISHI
jgi:hypothetical protein